MILILSRKFMIQRCGVQAKDPFFKSNVCTPVYSFFFKGSVLSPQTKKKQATQIDANWFNIFSATVAKARHFLSLPQEVINEENELKRGTSEVQV
jgi:hypothetical protein